MFFTLHHEYAHTAVCCMSRKVKFSFGGGELEGGGLGPLFLNFLDLLLANHMFLVVCITHNCHTLPFPLINLLTTSTTCNSR